MNSANLKYRINIYRQVKNKTDFGNDRITYEFKCSTRARVNFSSGSRTVVNEQIYYDVDREFIVRHYVDVVDTDIIEFDNYKWRILSIDHDRLYNDIVIRTTKFDE